MIQHQITLSLGRVVRTRSQLRGEVARDELIQQINLRTGSCLLVEPSEVGLLVNEVSEAFALASAISSQEPTCQEPRFWGTTVEVLTLLLHSVMVDTYLP